MNYSRRCRDIVRRGFFFNVFPLSPVPLKVLQDKFEDPPSEDEMNAVRDDDDEADDFDGYDTGDEFIRESAASPASPSSPNSDGTQRDNNNLNKDTDGSTSSPLSKGSHTIKSTDTNSENGESIPNGLCETTIYPLPKINIYI